MSGPEETGAASKPPKPRWRYWADLFLVCLVSVIASQIFAAVASKEAVDAARVYNDRALHDLQSAAPLQTYRLFRQSMGYPDEKGATPSERVMLARGLCRLVEDLQVARALGMNPEEGTLVIANSGRLQCAPPVPPPVSPALDLLRQNGLIKTDPLDLMIDLGSTAAVCVAVENEAASVRDDCLRGVPADVAGWGARLAAFSETFSFPPIRVVLWLLHPLAAMADVVWHNTLDWAPGALLRLTLVGIGFLLSAWVVLRVVPMDSPLLVAFAAGVLVPFGTVAISTGLIWICLKIAGYLLFFLGGALNLISATMVAGGVFSLGILGKTVLMMAEEHIGAARKRVAKS